MEFPQASAAMDTHTTMHGLKIFMPKLKKNTYIGKQKSYGSSKRNVL